jgi:hypothetical protein
MATMQSVEIADGDHGLFEARGRRNRVSGDDEGMVGQSDRHVKA